MICVGYACDSCKHEHEKLLDGWICTCDAFPEGIPEENYYYKTEEQLVECNNGIGFEKKEN